MTHIFLGDLVGLARIAVSTHGPLFTGFVDLLESLLARRLLGQHLLGVQSVQVHEYIRATETHTTEDLAHGIKELDEEDRFRKDDMPKMSRAEGIFLFTGTTDFVVLDDSHAWVEQSGNDRVISIKSIRRLNFGNTPSNNLIRTHQGELNPLNGIDVLIDGELLIDRHF